MEIQFLTEGGFAAFPALRRPQQIDTASLPADEAVKLEGLIAAIDFFNLPSELPKQPVYPDAFRYTITVKQGKRQHSIKRSDPLEDPQLAELVNLLRGYTQPPSR
jgi:hypothetical protein